jgi:outer membrane protein TolC
MAKLFGVLVLTAALPVRAQQTSPSRLPAAETVSSLTDDGLFGEQETLEAESLVELVLARNPSLEAMFHAWRAAAQRYPQAIALDDPMFMGMIGPASFNSDLVDPGYTLQASQKIPWCGKRQARGRAAAADARAMLGDARDERLAVALLARSAFYEYFLVHRLLDLNQLNRQVVRSFHDAAQSKYENNQVTEQDVLEADIELAEIERQQIELERLRTTAIARINTLLLRVPSAEIPLPPGTLALPPEVPSADMLREVAASQRPDLSAAAARTRAEQANLTLAMKQYYPDVDVFGRYDAFWQERELRPAVGVNMNVPIYHRKLSAGVCEARFRVAQRRAEYEQKLATVQFEVQNAHAQVDESLRTVELYATKILPTAERSVSVARSNYDVGKVNFLWLTETQRKYIELREQHQRALAELHSRIAALERAVGSPLPTIVP